MCALKRRAPPNNAHSVDTPIASMFYVVHPWRRATDAQRWVQMQRLLATIMASFCILTGCVSPQSYFSTPGPPQNEKILVFVGGNATCKGWISLPEESSLATIEDMVTLRPEWASRRAKITRSGEDLKFRMDKMTRREKEGIKLRHGDRIFFAYDRCFGVAPNRRPGVDAGRTPLFAFERFRSGTTQAECSAL
jgi:hypothetical protein